MTGPIMIADIPEAEYHADRTTFSQSDAKLILSKPEAFTWRKANPTPSTPAMERGTAAHTVVLGIGAQPVRIDATSWRTTAAKEAADEARRQGKVPLLPKVFDAVHAMADALSSHTLAMELLSAAGTAEMTAYAPHEPTGITRRARFDYITDATIVDYKTTTDASPAGFVRSCANFGYHIQNACYLDVATACGWSGLGLWFVAQETEPPYIVQVHELDDDSIALGRQLFETAIERFAHYRAHGFPTTNNQTTAHVLSLPPWAWKEAI